MAETQETEETAAPARLTKEQRSKIAKEAADRRWAKAKREKAKLERQAKKAGASLSKGSKTKKSASPREFTSALKMAEKRLAKAIQERAEAGAKYAVLSAEIPSLQRIIAALHNPVGYAVGSFDTAAFAAAPTLEQIVGDQPLAYQNPPVRRDIPQPITLPPAAHPVTSQGRAMGGAIGVELQEDENEDKFLRESPVAGGEWH